MNYPFRVFDNPFVNNGDDILKMFHSIFLRMEFIYRGDMYLFKFHHWYSAPL